MDWLCQDSTFVTNLAYLWQKDSSLLQKFVSNIKCLNKDGICDCIHITLFKYRLPNVNLIFEDTVWHRRGIINGCKDC